MLCALLALSSSAMGGWKKVDFDSEFVQNAMTYLRPRYMRLLPEYRNRNTLLAFQDAEIQVVNGYNIRINTKLGLTPYSFNLHFAPGQQNAQLLGITPGVSNEQQPIGGWRTQSNDFEPELISSIFGLYASNNGINAKLDKVVFIRTQVVGGLNAHVVFQDTDGNLHSVICYRNPQGEMSIQFESQL